LNAPLTGLSATLSKTLFYFERVFVSEWIEIYPKSESNRSARQIFHLCRVGGDLLVTLILTILNTHWVKSMQRRKARIMRMP